MSHRATELHTQTLRSWNMLLNLGGTTSELSRAAGSAEGNTGTLYGQKRGFNLCNQAV